MPRTIQSALAIDKNSLEAALLLDSATARTEVQMLLQNAMSVSRAHLLAHPEHELTGSEAATYAGLLQRRLSGEPLAYILGEREFFGLTFRVTRDVLIPRPETELLVDLALERIPSPAQMVTIYRAKKSGVGNEFRVLDLGTGSGAVALSIARARPDIGVTAVDASPHALDVAHGNARRLGIGNTTFVQSNWYSALVKQCFDLIVSNPPYVAEGDPHLQSGDLRYEPHAALVSGADGLRDIRHIVAHARNHLVPGGWLLFEHGYDQAAQARELLLQNDFDEVLSARDLAGIERVSGGRS